MKIRRRMLYRLTITLSVLTLIMAVGCSIGFEFGTGLSVVSLFRSHDVDITLPDITIKTAEEATQVVEEAVKGSTYEVGYNCLDYAWDSVRALQWDGQPAAIAVIIYEDGTGHALVLTATADPTPRWLFIDAQSGIEVYPVPGSYWNGLKIACVKVMVMHLVDFRNFEEDPQFEVME